MEIASALLTLAQVAVGLIGFSSVLVALSGEPSKWSPLDSYRIKGMLAEQHLPAALVPGAILAEFSPHRRSNRLALLGRSGRRVLIIGMIANGRSYLRLSDSYRAATRPPFVMVDICRRIACSDRRVGSRARVTGATRGTFFLGLFFILGLASYLIVRFLFARPNR